MTGRRLPLLAVALVLFAGCSSSSPSAGPSGSAGPTPSSGAIEHPRGPTDLILRFDEGGGFVPIEFLAAHSPIFSLYGDGAVIFRRLNEPTDPTAPGEPTISPPLRIGRLSEAQVQELLEFALRDGGLALARRQYDATNVADAPTATFVIDAGGVDKTVSVYALGIDAQPGGDAAIRAAFVSLAERLRDFDHGGQITSDVYRPERYRGVLVEGGGFGQPARPWPWSDLRPEDFQPSGNPDGPKLPSRVLTPEQAAAPGVTGIEGGVQGIVLEGPAGTAYSFVLRPLLPDEAD
jgi:hypothetical protein